MLKRIIAKTVGIAILSAAVGCATGIEKAPISATADPVQEIALFEQEFSQAGADHVDVLAPEDYKKAERRFQEAKSDLKDKQDREEILGDIAYARAYLARAQSTADSRRPIIPQILEARSAALKAAVHSNEELSEEMRDLDEKIENSSDDLRRELSSTEYSKLQSQYLTLELKALQNKYLASARAMIRDAKDDEKADRRAPWTLKKAQTDLSAAEQAIAVSRNDIPGFSGAVITANTSAQMLREVLTAMNNNNRIDEPAAIRLVRQEHQISKLQGTLGAAESDIEDMSARMQNQQRRLSSAQLAIGLQKALEKSQESFSKDEAEVFQQGHSSLVVRLKKMNFKSGSAQLGSSALPLLTKVNNVIADLNAKEVTVEGHTDSIGSVEKNLELSQKRAEIVAEYLRTNANGDYDVTSKGFGYSKPIADNKTKEGRMLNRRVDIVIHAVPITENRDSQLTEL